jgi:L-threonylcarbamoyladenylate synthase
MIYPVSEASLNLAAEAIRKGELAAFPTETVYGLGGDAFNPRALAEIFRAKGRPRFDPLIVHIACLEALEKVADLSALDPQARETAARLTREFWPGPLTLVLPKQDSIPGLATSGLATVAVRFPAHPAAQQLILLSTGAVAAPSANRFGRLSPTRAEHVAEQLGDQVGIILDGGPSAVGLESTVLDLTETPPRILRPGGLSRERLESLLGPLPGPIQEHPPLPGESRSPGELRSPGDLRSPGLLSSHYAPQTPLYLHDHQEMSAQPWEEDAGYLFFSSRSRSLWAARNHSPLSGENSKTLESLSLECLSKEGNTLEAAMNLFEALHRLDKLGLRCIHAEKAPPESLGEAINDRLNRASAPRTEG